MYSQGKTWEPLSISADQNPRLVNKTFSTMTQKFNLCFIDFSGINFELGSHFFGSVHSHQRSLEIRTMGEQTKHFGRDSNCLDFGCAHFICAHFIGPASCGRANR